MAAANLTGIGVTMPALPSLTVAPAGGSSGSSSNAGISLPINTPFNFDGSGWVVNFGDGNSTTATGNKDANASQQTPTAGGSSGLLGGGLGGLSTSTVLLLVAAYFLLSD